jgi:hypothetical protein
VAQPPVHFDLTGDSQSASGTDAYPTQAAPEGVAASSSATAAPSGPFARTRAANWAEGEAGITLPEATAVKSFTETQVAADLAAVKTAMVAARLDHRMLVDHDLSALLNLVSPSSRSYLTRLYARHELLSFATAVADGAKLSDLAPRMNGQVSFHAAKDEYDRPVLEIVTNFVWAYAFADGQVTLIHDQVHWRFSRAGDVLDIYLGPQPYMFRSYWLNIDCAAAVRGMLAPPTYASVSGGAQPTENPDNYYDPNHAMDVPGRCSPDEDEDAPAITT